VTRYSFLVLMELQSAAERRKTRNEKRETSNESLSSFEASGALKKWHKISRKRK